AFLRFRGGEFSTGTMGNFQPVLTLSQPALLRRSKTSARRLRLRVSLESKPKTKSRLSGLSPLQYSPPPALGTSFVPTAPMSPASLAIAAPTWRERSAERSAAA